MMSLVAFLKSEIVEARVAFCDLVAAICVATFGALPRPRTKCGVTERA